MLLNFYAATSVRAEFVKCTSKQKTYKPAANSQRNCQRKEKIKFHLIIKMAFSFRLKAIKISLDIITSTKAEALKSAKSYILQAVISLAYFFSSFCLAITSRCFCCFSHLSHLRVFHLLLHNLCQGMNFSPVNAWISYYKEYAPRRIYIIIYDLNIF